jgi:hypothetical protein
MKDGPDPNREVADQAVPTAATAKAQGLIGDSKPSAQGH